MKNYPLFLLLALVSSGIAETKSLVFTIQPNSQITYGMSASTGGSDTSTASASGTITADLTFDPATLVSQEFSLTGGRMALSNISLNLTTNVFFSGGGTFSTQLGFSTNQIAQTFSTPNPPGQVASTGLLTNSEHTTITNEGFATVEIEIPQLISDSEITNYTQNPETNEFGGTNALFLSATTSDLFAQNYRATITATTNRSESEAIPGSNLTLTLSQNGTLTAIADFSFPSPYGQWALDNNLSEPDPETTNPSGISYGVLFAFGLSANATSIPFKAISTPTGPLTQITLPAGGLAANIRPQYTPDLATEFLPLSIVNYLDGPNSLDAGKTGTVNVSFPAGTKGFMRLSSTMGF